MSRVFTKNLHPPTLNTTSVTLIASLYIVTAHNRFFWHSFISRLGLDSFNHWAFIFSVGVALVLLLNLLLSLLAARFFLKPFLIVLLLTTSAISYFCDTFGVIIDRSMVTNILETDIGEVSELLVWPLYRHMLLSGLFPAALVALTRISRASGKKEVLIRMGVIFGSLVVLLGISYANYQQFSLFGRENRDLGTYLNPAYPIYSLNKTIKEKFFVHAAEPLRITAPDAVRVPGPKTVVVLVLGETARAAQFAFNGYERDTNPHLAVRNIVNFSDVQSCGTNTSESVPCIFSSLERNKFSRTKAAGQENLLDILQRVGIRVLWRNNNSGSKGVAARVDYENLSQVVNKDLCAQNNCFDEILLFDLNDRLRESAEDMFIVLHMKGSHGPSYYKRYPLSFKIFTPECLLDNIQDCDRQSIINTYDNTIAYTDYVLAQIINLLQAQEFATAMLYVSDHGESLGENGLYLHGFPYALAPDEQTHVPMFFWASNSFLKNKGINLTSVKESAGRFFSHDFIFHSVLGLFDVQSRIYKPDLDLFAAQRHQSIYE